MNWKESLWISVKIIFLGQKIKDTMYQWLGLLRLENKDFSSDICPTGDKKILYITNWADILVIFKISSISICFSHDYHYFMVCVQSLAVFKIK